jgi:hypothetical protein
MNAADHLHEAIVEGCTRDDHNHIADHRAEVLREFADRLARRATLYGDSRTVHEVMRDLDRLATDAGKGTASSGESTQPADFFQPGRTYTYGGNGFTAPELITTFRVDSVTTHPETGHRYAFGWARQGFEKWIPYSEPEGDFAAFTEASGGDA